MVRRVYLHVGCPKSGTTYVQTRLMANAAVLADHGVHVRAGGLAFRAALDLTGQRLGRPRRETDGQWERLVEVVRGLDGTVVVSNEALVRADSGAVAQAMLDLGAGSRDVEVHVVLTARDLGRQLVSGWLEGLKHGGTATLAEHLERARSGELPALRGYDLPRLLTTWGDGLPGGRLHVVTAPPASADPALLWTRFLGVVGVDPGWALAPAPQANPALGVVEAQLLRALNLELGGAVRRGGRLHHLVQTMVVPSLSDHPVTRVALDPGHHAWVSALASEWVAWVNTHPVGIAGDLGDLCPVPVDPAGWVDPDVPDPAAAAVAAHALAALLRDLAADRTGPAAGMLPSI